MAAYDAIVIGAGHNGLVAANYLARRSRRVLVVEARDIVGGACVTEELIPGARWSSCAFIAGLLRPEIIDELELKRFGLELYQADVASFSLFRDGSHMFMYPELDRTLQAIEEHSRADAKAFLDFGLRMQRFSSVITPFLLRSPPSRSEVLKAFEDAGEQELFDEFVLLSTRDLLDKYFESDHVKGHMTFLGMVSIWGGPSTPGTAYTYGHHSWGEFEGQFGQWGFVRGGMGGITQALATAARHYGAEVRLGVPVASVRVVGGRVAGVTLEGGEEIDAPVVLSNADPNRSLLGFLAPGDLPAPLRQRVARIDMRGSMARVHLLVDELPDYLGFDGSAEGPQHRGHQLLGATVENFELAWEAQRRRELPREFVIEAVIQSTTDPSLSTPGRHTLTLGVQQLAYDLEGGWDVRKEEFTQRVLDDLEAYAPGIRNHILASLTITPLDIERDYGLTGGNIFHGAMFLDQLFGARPLPELSGYRTPVAGYYLCGSGTHPGGGVMGASGHNAAQVVLADTGAGAASTVTRPIGGTGRNGRTLIHRVMETDAGRRVGYALARHKAFRPVARLAARRRGHG